MPYATFNAIERYFHGSAAENMRALITRAFSIEPSERPTAEQCMDQLSG